MVIKEAGTEDAEEVMHNLTTWVWNVELNKWQTENERFDIDEREEADYEDRD